MGNLMQKFDTNLTMIFLIVIIGIYFIIGKMLNIQLSDTLFIFGWVLLFFIIVFIHGYKTLGLKEIIAFFLITYAITMSYEYTEAFGWGIWFNCRCFYSDLLGPKFLGKIPYIIPLTWSISLYCVFTMTNIIFRRIKTTFRSNEKFSLRWFSRIFGMGLIAGLIMISWDLINDPVFVKMGAWTWPNGGSYYGIPLANYAVWVEISAVSFIAYNIYLLLIRKNQIFIGGNKRSKYTLLVVLLYLILLPIYGVYAIYTNTTYAIPWATITMCSIVAVTIFQFYKFKRND